MKGKVKRESRQPFLEKVLPVLASSHDLLRIMRNYHRLRLVICVLMLTIAMGPVLMIAYLSYGRYNALIQKEESEQLRWQMEGSIKTIEQMIESLKSVILFVARRDRYGELKQEEALKVLFLRLNRQYPFFADLGVIDQEGVQQAYWGPYELQGTSYASESWFASVRHSGVYISNVYTGYREVPHFAVAVCNHDPQTHEMWILRATIDAKTLQQYVNTITTNAFDDLFLVDNQGVLQTKSSLYGEILSPVAFAGGLPDLRKTLYPLSLEREGRKFYYMVGAIKNSPWNLVLMRKNYVHQQDWLDFRSNIRLIIWVCLLVSSLLVYTFVNLVIGMLRRADELRLAMAREAEQNNKLASIGRLAAGVGHEINNPLAIINEKTGLIEDLLAEGGDFAYKDIILHNLRGIGQSVDRCKAITHRLLGFARRADILKEPLSVNEVIREVLQFLQNAMTFNRISLDLVLDENLPLVQSDRVQLQQILLNIINNAIDAIGKDGRIVITSSPVAGDVRLVIEDDGPGIEPEVLPHIFEPFYTTKETGKGTGLGLSITYGLIKKFGGDITVRSKKGTGTAFTITLPIKIEDDE